MSGLSTAWDALHDPKYRPWWKRLEVVSVMFVLSGAWIAAGYLWGVKDKDERFMRLQERYEARMTRKSEEYQTKLEKIKEQCVRKEIKQ